LGRSERCQQEEKGRKAERKEMKKKEAEERAKSVYITGNLEGLTIQS
jgi:hypothetical protein